MIIYYFTVAKQAIMDLPIFPTPTKYHIQSNISKAPQPPYNNQINSTYNSPILQPTFNSLTYNSRIKQLTFNIRTPQPNYNSLIPQQTYNIRIPQPTYKIVTHEDIMTMLHHIYDLQKSFCNIIYTMYIYN